MTDYIYNGSTQQNMTFQEMISLAQANKGGPQPRCRQVPIIDVYEGSGVIIPLNGTTKRYVAIPLYSCAAVIFTCADSSNAYLYHAPSGMVSQQIFNTAMAALGNVSKQNVYVIYTFPNPSDGNYYKDASELIAYGIPEVNIIYAPRLPDSFFGLTSQGIVG
jgi:hypothetical protein